MTGLYLRFLLLLFTDFFKFTFSEESYETTELGCFSDRYPDSRALTAGPYKVWLNFKNTDSMSPAHCIERCWNIGYIYSGVEYGEECHCGDNSDYGRFGKLDSSKCWYGCYNNTDLMCGGANAIQITLAYRTTTATSTSTARAHTSVLTKTSTEPSITNSETLTSTSESPTVTNTVQDNSTFYNKTEMTLLESSTAALRNTSLNSNGNGSRSDEIRFSSTTTQCHTDNNQIYGKVFGGVFGGAAVIILAIVLAYAWRRGKLRLKIMPSPSSPEDSNINGTRTISGSNLVYESDYTIGSQTTAQVALELEETETKAQQPNAPKQQQFSLNLQRQPTCSPALSPLDDKARQPDDPTNNNNNNIKGSEKEAEVESLYSRIPSRPVTDDMYVNGDADKCAMYENSTCIPTTGRAVESADSEVYTLAESFIDDSIMLDNDLYSSS